MQHKTTSTHWISRPELRNFTFAVFGFTIIISTISSLVYKEYFTLFIPGTILVLFIYFAWFLGYRKLETTEDGIKCSHRFNPFTSLFIPWSQVKEVRANKDSYEIFGYTTNTRFSHDIQRFDDLMDTLRARRITIIPQNQEFPSAPSQSQQQALNLESGSLLSTEKKIKAPTDLKKELQLVAMCCAIGLIFPGADLLGRRFDRLPMDFVVFGVWCFAIIVLYILMSRNSYVRILSEGLDIPNIFTRCFVEWEDLKYVRLIGNGEHQEIRFHVKSKPDYRGRVRVQTVFYWPIATELARRHIPTLKETEPYTPTK